MIAIARAFAAGAGAAAALAGCSVPTVNLATSQPIRVDINMRLDVYQHSGEKPGSAKPAGTPGTPSAGARAKRDPQASRDARAAEIQALKNSRLVGEGRDGLLVILGETPGEYGGYIRRTVHAENDDRMRSMKNAADAAKRSLSDLQKEQGELWRNRSFKGEWIEAPQPGGAFKWIQKGG